MAVREALHRAAANAAAHVTQFAETVVDRAPAVIGAARDAGGRILRELADVAPDVAQELQTNGWPEYWRERAPNARRPIIGVAMYVGAEAVDALAPPDPIRRNATR